jgi:hypothetical protein
VACLRGFCYWRFTSKGACVRARQHPLFLLFSSVDEEETNLSNKSAKAHDDVGDGGSQRVCVCVWKLEILPPAPRIHRTRTRKKVAALPVD